MGASDTDVLQGRATLKLAFLGRVFGVFGLGHAPLLASARVALFIYLSPIY